VVGADPIDAVGGDELPPDFGMLYEDFGVPTSVCVLVVLGL